LASGIVKKAYTHLGIEAVFLEIFDQVARRLESRTLPRHTRAGFINKAARLWVDAVKEEVPDLKPIIEEIELRHAAARAKQPRQSGKAGKVLRLRPSSGGD
jgi:hypothetical protein